MERYILLNYAFLLFWSILGEIHRELLFFCQNNDYCRNEHRKTQKVCFSYHVWKWKILRIIRKCLNKFFVQTSRHKSDYLRKQHWNTQKICFSYHVWKRQILRKIWICLNNCFWSNLWKGININKNCFSPQNEPQTAKLCLSVVLKHFGGNLDRTFIFRHKSDYCRKEHWNTQKVCFSYHVWKLANTEEN